MDDTLHTAIFFTPLNGEKTLADFPHALMMGTVDPGIFPIQFI